MRKSFGLVVLFVLIITGSWLFSDSLFLSPFDQKQFGYSFTQLSGILAIALMCFSTLLAIRPIWLEPWLGGLDKMYRLHKWSSIIATFFAVTHWLTAQSPNGHHGPQATAPVTTVSTGPFSSLEGPAIAIAQPALWILLALVAVALIKKIPYHIFALTHRLVPIVFLALLFHSIVYMKAVYWPQPIGIMMAVICVFGGVAALVALFRMIGARRKVFATVADKFYLPDVKSLRVDLQMAKGWQGHKPGQFAFVSSQKRWGAHPFTIASHWNPDDEKISFIVKELGDTTGGLQSKLSIGTELVVEGPYGHFNFEDSKQRQIWISGGIGITPFVARMKQLTDNSDGRAIDLFHSDAQESSQAHRLLVADATAANVNVHIFVTPKDGRVTGPLIRQMVPDWKTSSIWFCGPSRFAATLKLDLMRNGLNSADFHHELFEMR